MIDFTTLFAKERVERLNFHTRSDVNYHHEIIFLSSYLHDARFKRSEFILKDGEIGVLLDRDCWEFYSRIHDRKNTSLLSAPSLLRIRGVDTCSWSANPDVEEIWIRSVFIGERQQLEQDTAHLVLDCSTNESLRIDLIGSDSCFAISLEDQADPK